MSEAARTDDSALVERGCPTYCSLVRAGGRSVRSRLISALLGASGLLCVAAAAVRWSPACGPGGFDNGACLAVQDDAYDFTDPRSPWSPVGHSAELYGISLLLLAVAIVILPQLLLGRHPARVHHVSALVVAAGVGATGVRIWLSGHADSVVELPGGVVTALLWALAWPGLVVTLLTQGAVRQVVHQRWHVAVGACLALASPVPQIFVPTIVLGYVSYDTTPWSEAVGGIFLIAAAALVWPLPVGRREKVRADRAPTDSPG